LWFPFLLLIQPETDAELCDAGSRCDTSADAASSSVAASISKSSDQVKVSYGSLIASREDFCATSAVFSPT
jgi:hypothetical protein